MTGSIWASPLTLPLRLIGFLSWFTGQFVLTSLKVVGLILTPGKQPSPGIVRMKIDSLSETEITILVILITLTPDTLVIAVDREAGHMFVHGMFVAEDAESFRSSLRVTHDWLLFGVRARPDVHPRRGVSL